MSPRETTFLPEEIELIHQATLELFAETGVQFPNPRTLEIFRDHGFRVEGERVHITPEQLDKALSTCPDKIAVRARNPGNDLLLGGDDFVLGPSCGNIQILDAAGGYRPCTLEDYDRLAKLVQTSPLKMFSGGICYPREVPGELAHLHMVYRDLVLTDRAAMCNVASRQNALDSLKYLEIVFGGREEVRKSPCSISVINPFSPLKYADDQSAAIEILAAENQPLVVTNMVMTGATAPITVAGALAVGNAEILAGVVLAQLVRPGVGVVYGTTSCPMDMKSMVATLGTPETIWLARGALALAGRYNLPSRVGGSLTDSHAVDAQALMDGALIMSHTLLDGANFVFHAFGMVGGYLAVSLEKFVLDEELARLVMASMVRPEISEKTLELPVVKELGPGGDYLTHPSTLRKFRKLFRPSFLNRSSYEAWTAKGSPDALAQAAAEVEKRVASWEKPPLDPGIEDELRAYALSRGAEIKIGA
ncbi:MAG: trimethylamine methyltransferase family protein [Deltaproteobacteria bacterium]|jgi:trimethylamine--corrinoid protein Co-methyltransferase|nr:trimethylamine methyltransferase family protein [Deltaproteobacteria bacterium]